MATGERRGRPLTSGEQLPVVAAGHRSWAPGDPVRSALVVTAHPDDVDFAAAGSVARLTADGIDVTYCIVTDGDAGGSDRSVSRAEVAAVRRDEQRAAAARVGVTDVRFLGHPDGRVTASLELRRDISRVIRQVRPERVITHSPQRTFDHVYPNHPDHLAVGEAALCAVYPDARNPFAHPELLDDEGLEPHAVDEVWVMIPSGADLVVDTTTTMDDKVAALLCHKSQIGDPEELTRMVHTWSRATAAGVGLPEGSFAETFQVVGTR